MEMKDDLEMKEHPLLAIGRPSFVLGSDGVGCPASSSQWPAPVCSGSNVNSKKSQMDDGEFWQRENDAWRGFPGELSQTQVLPGPQRAKRQDCTELIQGYWDANSCNMTNVAEPGSGMNRASMENEPNLGGSSSGLFELCEVEPRLQTTDYDFFRVGADVAGSGSSSSFPSSWITGNGFEEVLAVGSSSMEDKVRNWSGVDGSCPIAVGVGDTSSSMTSFRHVPGSDVVESPEIKSGQGCAMEHQNRVAQATLSGTVGYRGGPHEVQHMYLRANTGDGSYLDPSICAYPSSLPEAERGKSPFQIGSSVCRSICYTGNNRSGHVIGGRRSSCKRKISTSDLSDVSSLRASQISNRRESNSTRTGGGSGPSTTDPRVLTSAATPDAPTNTASHNGGTLVGNENDLFESIRGSRGKASTVGEPGGGTQRPVSHRFVNRQMEESHSQLHSLFARNLRRSTSAAPPQTLFSRGVFSAEQTGDFSGMTNTGSLHESDHWSIGFGQRGSTAVSQGGDNAPPRGNSVFSRFDASARERASVVFDGSRMRSTSSRFPSWLGGAPMGNRLANRTSTSGGVTCSTARVMNPLEVIAHDSQGVIPPFHPTVASSPQFPLLLSNGRTFGGIERSMAPPALSSMIANQPAPFGSSIEVAPTSEETYASPCPSVPRPSLFLHGQGEGILAAPVQSILGLPFHGLHILPADGEHRQRFVSEILSALEHAWRREDISFEELVMLDPSLIYGGIDIHDQHSDLRLDVDNMSYEELLALEESIGNVSTGLSDEIISKCLRESKYSSLYVTVASRSQESDMKCIICQEEYVEEDDLGSLDCGHAYHRVCIRQWLLQKNQCPICKSAGLSKS